MRRKISLVVFDIDDTLLYALDGGYLSGKTHVDVGEDQYTFEKVSDLEILRSDGQRFRLFPDARPAIERLHGMGVLLSAASFNVPGPVYDALRCLGLDAYLRHPVVEWSSRKDVMLATIIARFLDEGYPISAANTLFIDDDHSGAYRGQMASIGVAFLQKGVDLHDFNALFDHPEFELAKPFP